MQQKQYNSSMCNSVRNYFKSFIGYWDRRIAEIEKQYPGDDVQMQHERIAAFERIGAEMSARARLRGLPSLEKWAKNVNVNPSTVSRWRNEYPEFDEACRDCQAIQNDILRDGGLGGIYASRVATFLIKMNEERLMQDEDKATSGMRLEDFDDAEEEAEGEL